MADDFILAYHTTRHEAIARHWLEHAKALAWLVPSGGPAPSGIVLRIPQ